MPASTTLHEPADEIGRDVIDRHRAIASLGEEFEAVDWYDQRVAATTDESLRAILAHNRDEEKEHAMMTLEWLRRRDAVLDQHMRTYLFTDAPVTEVEVEAEGKGDGDLDEPGDGDLGLRGLGRGGL